MEKEKDVMSSAWNRGGGAKDLLEFIENGKSNLI